MGGSIFFEKNLRIQFDVVFASDLHEGIFDSLASFGGELWRFVNLPFVRHHSLHKIFFEDFFLQIDCLHFYMHYINKKVPPTQNFNLRKKGEFLHFFQK